MTTKKLIIAFMALFIFSFAYSQKVLLEKTVDENPDIPKWGKNYLHYGHLYGNFGVFVGQSDADINYGLTNSFGFGYRYKLKLLKHYAIGADLNLSFLNYNLKEDYLGVFSNADKEKQKMRYKALSLELYQRINFGKRGNYIGNYIDIGFYTGFNFRTKLVAIDKSEGSFYTETKTIYKNLDFINYYSYGLNARIGINRWVVFAQYRLSNIIEWEGLIYPDGLDYYYGFSELPKLLIGIELSFF